MASSLPRAPRMNEVDGPPARLTAPGPPIHDFRTAPGSPSSSRRSSTSDPSHAARRLAALGLPPSGPVRLPETEHDAERLAAAEAEVRAHLRKRRRRRSLFLSPGTGRARPFAEESTPSTAVAATAASDPASRPPASAAALVPAPPQLPRIPSTAAARSSSSSLSASSSASSASPVSLAINDAAAGPSTPSPTTFNKIRRRRSTLTAATDVPWTPPSPLSATPGGGPLSSSKVGLKVRRALSLLAHGDGHEYAGDSPPRTSHPDGDQHHHHHHHHRSGQHRHPYQSVGASGTQDYLSRRESKRREKAEAEAHAAQQAAASAWLAERANSIAHNGGTASSTLEGPFSVLDSPYPYPAPGVRLEERTTDSPREAYLNRRESLLRNLRASLSVGNGSGTPTSASSRYGGGGGGALPAGVGGTAVGTIGEEPELERRLDGAFEAAADRRRRHERWREGLPTTMTATASTSRAGSPPATATPAGAGWLPDPPLARLDTPTSVYGGVDQGSSRWRGKTNPFDGSPGNGTGSGPGGGGGSGSFPLRAGSALGSPRPSFRSSPSAGSTSVFPPSNDEINGGRQTPPVNGGGRSSSPPLSTGLSPPVADRRRPSARRSVSPSFPRSASSATSSPALSRHNSFGPSNPTASGPGGLGGGGRRSPLGNEHLLPPIHLEAPTPLTGRTPHASPGRLAGGRELAPDRGDDGRVSGLVHSSPESIDGVFLSSTADGRLDGGAAAGDPSPGRSLLEDDRSPVGSASTLPFYPHQLQQRPPPAEQISSTTSLTNAARRKMLAALDTSAQIGPPAACGSASSGHRLLPTKSNDEGGATELADLARLTSDGPTGLGLLGTDDLELVDERLRSQRRPSVDAVSQSGSVARRPEGMALGQEGRHVVWERLWENQRGFVILHLSSLFLPSLSAASLILCLVASSASCFSATPASPPVCSSQMNRPTSPGPA